MEMRNRVKWKKRRKNMRVDNQLLFMVLNFDGRIRMAIGVKCTSDTLYVKYYRKTEEEKELIRQGRLEWELVDYDKLMYYYYLPDVRDLPLEVRQLNNKLVYEDAEKKRKKEQI